MAQTIRSCSTTQIIEVLAEQVRQIEGTKRPAPTVISSGSPALDRLLPDQGLRSGSLVEWLLGGAGSGAATLALGAARQAAGDEGTLVVVDRKGLFYPPAAANLGIDLARLIVVRPESDEDHAWALDQVLRCPGVAAAWCFPGEQDNPTWRRWQLAAEASGVLGLLLRSAGARHEPCWAELRLLVEPIVARPIGPSAGRSRRFRVELLRSRTGHAGGTVELEIPGRGDAPRQERLAKQHMAKAGESNDETRTVHLASQLAAPKTRRRSRRA